MTDPVKTCPDLSCPACNKKLLTNGVLTARVLRLGTERSEARCNRCKRWIFVPVVLARTLSR